MIEIECKELTPERRKILATREAASFGKPLRLVLAAGGAYIFYYGTKGEAPVAFQGMANLFAAVGIAAVLFAVFSQKLAEMHYFAKAAKKGCFPESVSVGEGGVFIRRRSAGKASGIASVNAERFYAFAEIGEVEDLGDYIKLNLIHGNTSGIVIFKEDFGKENPEAFNTVIASRKRRYKNL